MMSLFTYSINKFAVYLAISCFSIGTLLFLIQVSVDFPAILGIGFAFVLLAVLTNSITLLVLAVNTVKKHQDFDEHIIAIVLLLANIPISIFYLNSLTL
ncbi:hypothetical protein MWU65_04240 [Cellulophaga sp. F20128]|uniref:hypothetical protein n=1 Tax=Cellulophaga sp. F20128 TaxID=2926413 RepID=UPI001FF46119|nr:hypothetical protein [Cellulophaga sp. F20128]MCK0156375.1 hypothetical protein [Cellulophaga sp. F20128]